MAGPAVIAFNGILIRPVENRGPNMSYFSSSHLQTLEKTALAAAAYLDACDGGSGQVRLDPAYYKACGALLMTIFGVVDARQSFPSLLEASAAARDVAESVQIGQRIEVSRLGYYPELAVLMNRVSAD